ncbi:MAG TPA: MaoC family dehydratase N-terminal domain-containing protein [Ornithinimicrobium sp.]|uniref:FAS1-like dehydratase domain-containing protein n=1 Tax=Ornithinimicrobium sp. TaxID=1977084 RepID=UPI002B46CAC6|nr:MaoC family dehydratase N-terminal domain-containing protein [Ornithinimicrobium sp.]HKJ11320.1 MaoC family dehydratase N-terminal domain-containing protein [Ornithinimicrobium sp.]
MAVNPDFAGREYPPTGPYSVSATSIAAFAQAVGAENVLHTDTDAAHDQGYAGVVAPPTYAVVIAQQCEAQYVADPEAGIDFSRVVHGEQRFDHHSPIVAGDELVGTLHVDALRQVGGNSMVTTRTELARTGGEPVSTVTSMLVVRGEEG